MKFSIIVCLITLDMVTPKSLLPHYNSYPSFALNQDSEAISDSSEIQDQLMDLKTIDDKESEEVGMEIDKTLRNNRDKKSCAMVVFSNSQNPLMQSLMRKYRYDSKGVLIPSSVKYFMKLRDGLPARAHIVQLNDKAFTPLGGFVRYYKKVPPIPQSL